MIKLFESYIIYKVKFPKNKKVSITLTRGYQLVEVHQY